MGTPPPPIHLYALNYAKRQQPWGTGVCSHAVTRRRWYQGMSMLLE